MSISEEPDLSTLESPENLTSGYPGSPISVALTIGFLALCLSLARHLPFANEHYLSWEASLTQNFHRFFAENWNNQGFLATEGRPIRGHLLPEWEAKTQVYVNHPPFCSWVVYAGTVLFGRNEFGFRFFPTLATALAAALLAAFASRKLGPWAGVGVIAMFLSLPITFFYGRCANYEAFVTLFGSAAILMFLTKKGWLSTFVSVGLWFCTAMFDWVALIILCALFAVQLVIPQIRRRGFKPLFWSVGVAFIGFFSLIAYWFGSIDDTVEALLIAFNFGTQGGGGHTWTEFFNNQEKFWLDQFTWAGIAVIGLGTIIGFVQIFRRRCSAVLAMGMVWWLAAILNVVAFPGRALNHEMWWYLAAPAAALFTGEIVAGVAKRTKIVAIAILMAIVFFNVEGTIDKYHYYDGQQKRRLVEKFDKRFDQETLLIDAYFDQRGSWSLCTSAWIYSASRKLEQTKLVVEEYYKGSFSRPKLAIWFNTNDQEFRSKLLEDFQKRGAILEVEGDYAFLMFPRP